MAGQHAEHDGQGLDDVHFDVVGVHFHFHCTHCACFVAN